MRMLYAAVAQDPTGSSNIGVIMSSSSLEHLDSQSASLPLHPLCNCADMFRHCRDRSGDRKRRWQCRQERGSRWLGEPAWRAGEMM